MGQKEPIKPRSRMSKEERAARPSFEARISHAAKELEEKAWGMPAGPECDALLRRARQMDVTSHLREWLSSPGLQPPK
jgi:hypothetical protein